MKATVKRTTLTRAASAVVKYISPNPIIKQTGHIALSVTEGGVQLSATNIGQVLRISVPAIVEEPGTLTVPGKSFSDFLSALSGNDVVLSAKALTLSVAGGRAKANLSGLEIETFPFGETTGVPVTEFAAPRLESIIRRVSFAAMTAPKGDSPVLSGIYFKVDSTGVLVEAGDNYRFSYLRDKEAKLVGEPCEFTVPASALGELVSLIHATVEPVHLSVARSQENEVVKAIFWTTNWTYISQVIAERFPDLSRVANLSFACEGTLDRKEFMEALGGILVLAREYDHVIYLEPKPKDMLIESKGGESGDAVVRIGVEWEGKLPPRLAVSGLFLKESLSAIDNAQVKFLWSEEGNHPIALVPVGDDDDMRFLHIMMPRILK